MAVSAMLSPMRARGPDMGAVVANGPMAFGHRRLSIIEPSTGSRQPMADRSGVLWITFNGEIYNYRELRAELAGRGAVFRTQSDTEVILEAYSAWGPDCVSRLNGMFAFALWDGLRRQVLLARDRAGKKPLCYAQVGDGLIFASTLDGLLAHPELSLDIDPSTVGDFLSLSYVPTDASMARGVVKLPPACTLQVTPEGVGPPRRYWDLAAHFRAKSRLSESEASERLAELIDDSVRLRLVSDVPLGAFLSGGIDSSTIVTAMSALQGGDRTCTFSIGFDERGFDELDEARAAAAAAHTSHQDQVVRTPDADDLVHIISAMDEPLADTSFIPMWYLARFARNRVTVSLSGDGGDELFAGYETYVADRLHHQLSWLPMAIRRQFPYLAGLVPVSFGKVGLDYKLRQFASGCVLDGDRAHHHWREVFAPDLLQSLLRPEHRARCRSSFEAFRSFAEEMADAHPLDRASYVDIKTWMVDDILAKVDRSTMAHSLEARAPFLDYRVMEFAASLPVNMKLKGLRKKHILKESQRNRLSAAIIERRKLGFNAPVSHWLVGRLEGLARDVTFGERLGAWVERGAVEELWRDHVARRADNGYRLFTLTCLGLWLEQAARPKAISIDSDVIRIDLTASTEGA